MDLLEIFYEDENCLFRAISWLTYETPDHHKKSKKFFVTISLQDMIGFLISLKEI